VALWLWRAKLKLTKVGNSIIRIKKIARQAKKGFLNSKLKEIERSHVLCRNLIAKEEFPDLRNELKHLSRLFHELNRSTNRLQEDNYYYGVQIKNESKPAQKKIKSLLRVIPNRKAKAVA